MGFLDEVNEIKQERQQRLVNEKVRKQEQEKNDFRKRIQEAVNSLEEIKEGIKAAAARGDNKYTVINRLVSISPPFFKNTTEIEGYQCVKTTILTSEHNSQGFNGRWYFVNINAGKEVILDEELMQFWKMLESLGLRPFFYGGANSADLCVGF